MAKGSWGRGAAVAVMLAALAGGAAFSLSRTGEGAAEAAEGARVQIAQAQSQPRFRGRTPEYNANRNAYFGDTHVHTRYSFDAYIFNVRATPDDAYLYAKGQTIKHALGYDVRLTDAPLDFLAVTDHAEYIGVLPAMNDPNHPLSKVPYAPELFSTDRAKISAAFQRIGASLRDGKYLEEIRSPETRMAAWADIKAAAERHYEPGRFTTFAGYEYTSAPDGKNLHRNVIFRGAAPELPFSAMESQNPENLWKWMDDMRRAGMESLAMPHNQNGSDGKMYELQQWDGSAFDAAYAELRNRNEPLAEMTQVKGTSETYPGLSPNDEWADFEIMTSYIGDTRPITQFKGSYVRDALLEGLRFEETQGFNPFKFGFIGASDTHNAAGAFEENHYFSKVGIVDGTAEARGSVPPGGGKTWDGYEPDANTARYQQWGASGLAGVWAEENTRDSIYAALRRRETFATSGPRMRVRFFAGYDFPANLDGRPDAVPTAYRQGVPMGSDLAPRRGKTPQFLVWAVRDPHSGWLQRAQVVKGWIENGQMKEQVFDVACSDGLTPDPTTHRCGDNGARVNLANCQVTQNKGAAELRTVWTDPTFNPAQRAFYYVRVLENPSCRWSTWDALRAGIEPNPKLKATIQERAWTSPIWYAPRG